MRNQTSRHICHHRRLSSANHSNQPCPIFLLLKRNSDRLSSPLKARLVRAKSSFNHRRSSRQTHSKREPRLTKQFHFSNNHSLSRFLVNLSLKQRLSHLGPSRLLLPSRNNSQFLDRILRQRNLNRLSLSQQLRHSLLKLRSIHSANKDRLCLDSKLEFKGRLLLRLLNSTKRLKIWNLELPESVFRAF